MENTGSGQRGQLTVHMPIDTLVKHLRNAQKALMEECESLQDEIAASDDPEAMATRLVECLSTDRLFHEYGNWIKMLLWMKTEERGSILLDMNDLEYFDIINRLTVYGDNVDARDFFAEVGGDVNVE